LFCFLIAEFCFPFQILKKLLEKRALIKNKVPKEKFLEFMEGNCNLATFYAQILQKNRIDQKDQFTCSQDLSDI